MRSVLCSIVCDNYAQTYGRLSTWSLDWVLSHCAHFTVLRFIFVYMYFVYVYFVLIKCCSIVT